MTLAIRPDHSAAELRAFAHTSPSPRAAARALAIANALEGLPRAEAAQRAGMNTQTLRDAVIRYNEEGLPGLQDRPRSGRPPKLTAQERAALAALVQDAGPGRTPTTHKELAELVWTRFGKRLHPASVRKLLRRMGVSRRKPTHWGSNNHAA